MTESKPNASGGIELSRQVEEARARWPLVALDEAAFRRHLAALGRPEPVYAADAYLAAACASGDAAALRVVEEELVARIPEVVRRVDGSPAFAHEIAQQLRIRLFVSETDAPPRIARYTGEVPLSAWLRVIALRLAFNAKRGTKAGAMRAEADAGEAAADLGSEEPELAILRGQYREPFARAFEDALAVLPKDDRTVLRLHYVDGLNIDGIGTIFGVHRATVARWLVRIRSEVLEKAKALLAERVGAELDEAGSVIGALAGEVDVTLSRVLGRSPPSP